MMEKDQLKYYEMWCEGLTQEEWDEKYDDAMETEYLHGLCHEWLNAHYQDGDECLAIMEIRDGNRLCLMHCCLKRGCEYIDVRGNTDDFYAVIDAFDYGHFDVEIYDSLEEFNNRMRQIGVI